MNSPSRFLTLAYIPSVLLKKDKNRVFLTVILSNRLHFLSVVCRVLDLFAGSGGLAIEAVSRGMSAAVLVEKNRKAQAIIQDNIIMTKAENRFTLLKMEAERAIDCLTGRFDLVFLDPPYAKETIVATIEALAAKNLLSEQVMVVCETDKTVLLPKEIATLGIWKEKIYGISKVTVYVN